MLQTLRSLLRRAFPLAVQRPVHEEGVVYFGGIVQNEDEFFNEMHIWLYEGIPSHSGVLLSLNRTMTTDETVEKQLRSMDIGEAFKITKQGNPDGDILEIERFAPLRHIQIQGQPSKYPDAPFYRINTLDTFLESIQKDNSAEALFR